MPQIRHQEKFKYNNYHIIVTVKEYSLDPKHSKVSATALTKKQFKERRKNNVNITLRGRRTTAEVTKNTTKDYLTTILDIIRYRELSRKKKLSRVVSNCINELKEQLNDKTTEDIEDEVKNGIMDSAGKHYTTDKL